DVCSPDLTQSPVFFFSKRHSLQIKSLTSPHWSFLAVTRYTSSPRFQMVTFPEHFGQSRWASCGFKNHTRFLNRKVLSVRAPTGQTSITFPMKSLSSAL